MAIHTAIMDLVNIDNNGKIVSKSDATIGQVMTNLNTDRRVFEAESGSAPNAASSKRTGINPPSIHEYLVAEDGDGFSVVYMDQYYIITQN